MLIIKNSHTDPAFNLALEEILLTEFSEDVFMLWQNKRAVIVGNNQNTVSEIDGEFAERNGISVIRRLTGGGAVFHDMGNLNFTFIKRGAKDKFLDFGYFLSPIKEHLSEYGFDAVTSERNDILIDGKKVSGNAQKIYRGSVLHHGTLMFGVDVSVLAQVLKPNPLKIKSKAVGSVRSRVANMNDLLGRKIDINEFKTRAEEKMRRLGSSGKDKTVDVDEDAELLARVEELVKNKYATYEWNFGYSPDYEYRNCAYTAGGLVEVFMRVECGKIAAIKFFGDFSGVEDVSTLETALTGAKRTESDIGKILDDINPDLYMRGVPRDELIKLLK